MNIEKHAIKAFLYSFTKPENETLASRKIDLHNEGPASVSAAKILHPCMKIKCKAKEKKWKFILTHLAVLKSINSLGEWSYLFFLWADRNKIQFKA